MDLHAWAFERERQSCHHEEDVIGNRGHALVDFAQQIAVTAAQRERWNDAATHLVRDQND